MPKVDDQEFLTSMNPKKVLVITYYFPPVGGAGVQRITKFVRYLPRFNWHPTVLTVSNPSVPVFDVTLENEIPTSIDVIKANTLEPSYETKKSVSSNQSEKSWNPRNLLKKFVGNIAGTILQPDPQILWLPSAYYKARQLINSELFDAILTTAPPFSSFVLGAFLHKSTRVPLILDYRDEWNISNSSWEHKKRNWFTAVINKRLQNFAVNQANAIIATTRMSAHELSKITNSSKSKPDVYYIYNGYDSNDLDLTNIDSEFKTQENSDFQAQKTIYNLSYIGTLWNLTSVYPIVQAFLSLDQINPELTSRIIFSVAGRRTPEQEVLLNRLYKTNITICKYEYLSHADALNLMNISDGLLLLLSNYEYAGRVVPAKLFEYMAFNKTIFNISPKGEVWEILNNYPVCYSSSPDDIPGIEKMLETELHEFFNTKNFKRTNFDASMFDRLNLTGELASILEQISSTNTLSVKKNAGHSHSRALTETKTKD